MSKLLAFTVLACFAAGAYAEKGYVFDRDGQSSVSFDGQTARLNMADEIYDALNTNETTDKAMLIQMYTDGTGFSDATLDESGKNVGGKTAAGCLSGKNEELQEKFVTWLDDFADNVVPAWDTPAADGSAGFLEDDKRKMNVNAQGWELDQVFQKSLIGAFALDQIVNNYLAACKLDAGTNQEDNTNGVTADGKSYTKMEHAWDEAFGYLYGQEEDPGRADLGAAPSGSGTLMNKYLKKTDAGDVAPGIAQSVYDAFVTGRQAIVDGDYETRDAQAKIIQVDLSKVIGAMVVNYLDEYMAKKADTPADAIHALSEGYGFVFSLPFTNDGTGKPYFTEEEVEGFLTKMNNFWTVDDADLTDIVAQVQTRFGFEGDDAAAGGEGGDDAAAGGEGDDAAAGGEGGDAPAEMPEMPEEPPASDDDGK